MKDKIHKWEEFEDYEYFKHHWESAFPKIEINDTEALQIILEQLKTYIREKDV